MGKQVLKAVFLGLLLAAATGCVQPLDGNQEDGAAISTSLALSLKNAGSQGAATKMSQEITQTQQSGNNFRGIEEVIVVPFRTVYSSAVEAEDTPIGTVGLQNPGISSAFAASANAGLVNRNNSHYYENASIPTGMNRALAYGKAIDKGTVSTKEDLHRNGVLTTSVTGNISSANDITFSLLPINTNAELSNNVEAKIDVLIEDLNGVASALRDASEPAVYGILESIKREGQILSCSYVTFDYMMKEVVTQMQQAGNSTSFSTVMTAITQLDDDLGSDTSFPSSYGIPEGAFGFWWNGDRFVRLISNVNIALIDPAQYCYPPSLWYYTNSPIRTTKADGVIAQYKEENANWNQNIVDEYYKDDQSVTSSSRSVAIESQLQYGVAMLELSLGVCEVADAIGCQLTGIIIGDQKDVDFNFNPLSSASRYVYDNVVSGLSLASSPSATAVETLVLQTGDNNKIHFALEFKNTTGNTLHGQQGDILPKAKFYLAGELDPNAVSVRPQGVNSVFLKDHKTHVTAKVKSLAGAYNTVPDLHAPQLEIGVVADMKWDQITPKSVKLDM